MKLKAGGAIAVLVSLAWGWIPTLTAAEMRFTVGATIRPGCLIDTASAAHPTTLGRLGTLDFGQDAALSHAPHSAHLVQGSSVVLHCTPGMPLLLRVDGGQHYKGERRMQREGGNAQLSYALYQDVGLQQPLNVDQPVAVNPSTSLGAVDLPLHASVSLPGDLPAGRYHDTLTLTLQW